MYVNIERDVRVSAQDRVTDFEKLSRLRVECKIDNEFETGTTTPGLVFSKD